MTCPTPAFSHAPKPRRFAGLTVKHIRTFATFEAASHYIDMRLAQLPSCSTSNRHKAAGL